MTSIKDFHPLQKLGEGSFSSVFLVKRISDQKLYALKKVKLGSLKQKEKQNSVNEVRLLASLNSDYIIGYKDSFFDENSSILCVVMEYAADGDLSKKIAKNTTARDFFPQNQIWKAFKDLLLGLKTLHDKKILHRDLKAANIFISEGKYKIGDLNVSKVAKQNLVHTQTGTPFYASPQVWRDEPYDSKCDIWSLGCIIYEMACLKTPFRGKDMQSLFKSVQKGQFDRLNSKYSLELSNMIGLCLRVNARSRPSAGQLLKSPAIQRILKLQSSSLSSSNNQLLKTIKIDKTLKGLQKNLPKPNYSQRGLQKRPISAAPNFSAAVINRITSEENRKKELLKQNQPEPTNPKIMSRVESPRHISKVNKIQQYQRQLKLKNQSKKRVDLAPFREPLRDLTPKKEPGKINKKPYRVQSAREVKVRPIWWG